MNNQEFYKRVDDLCVRLRQIGMIAEANRISNLLHKIAWTSTSELIPALETAFRDILSGVNSAKLPSELRQDIVTYIETLDRVF